MWKTRFKKVKCMRIHPDNEKIKYMLETFIMNHPYIRLETNGKGEIVISDISDKPSIEYDHRIPREISSLLKKRDEIDKQILEEIVKLNNKNIDKIQ